MRAIGSGTSVTSIGPSASVPQSSMVTPGCSTVYAVTARPVWSLPTSPSGCIESPTLRATQLAITWLFAPVSTSIHTGSPATVPCTSGSGNLRPLSSNRSATRRGPTGTSTGATPAADDSGKDAAIPTFGVTTVTAPGPALAPHAATAKPKRTATSRTPSA